MSDHNHSDEISTLNTLIATTIDSITGYENSAEDIDSQRFREIFRQRADERQRVVEELRSPKQHKGYHNDMADHRYEDSATHALILSHAPEAPKA